MNERKSYIFCPFCKSEMKDAERFEEGKMVVRRMCSESSCSWIHYNNPLPVVGAIIEVDDRVLLVQNKGWPKNFFALVTGYLEKGEDPKDGILREVKEELGIDVIIKELVGVYEFSVKNEILIVYLVVPKEKDFEEKLKLSEELADFKFVPIHKLKPWRAGTGFAVKEYLEKKLSLSKL